MPDSPADQNAHLDAADVAALLREFGRRIELSDESPYKARAYFRAAESLLALTEPLGRVIAEGRLRDIPGVGQAIGDMIVVLHRTGTHATLEQLRREVPASALELLRIPGLTPPKARQLLQELKIDGLAALEHACRRGALNDVRGFGPAWQERILHGIDLVRRSRGQRLLSQAGELLGAMTANLAASHPELDRVTAAGDFRRGCELVHDLALVARAPSISETATTSINDEVELTVAEADLYGLALLFATGSPAHLEALRAFAEQNGLSLSPAGLLRGKKRVPCREEADVYAALGLPFIAPELRESGEEVGQAAENRLPALVEASHLHGVLHCHTTFSDGVHSLEEMAEASRARGYQYFGVADHSKSAGYAGGLSLEEIAVQHAEADRLNRRWRGKFRILKGIESDILLDGSLDYPDEVLQSFDFVVASIHSRFRLDEGAQTERVLSAVANPRTTILGHMTGRLLLRREGYALDVDQVLRACAEHGVAVEINASPRRLDLDWRWHRRALELGCMLSINPDAHSIAELDFMQWGLAAARKGGVPKERILNAMNLKAITAHLQQRKVGS
jgi:DNA polymerase (family 10)